MFDIISNGDLIIDFVQCGYGPNGNPAYEMNPGGAPVNYLVMASRLGAKTAFIGMVGDDLFGNYAANAVLKYGVSDRGIVKTNVDHTTVSFVSLDENGDRSFYFVGPGVDKLISPGDVDAAMLKGAKIIYAGGNSYAADSNGWKTARMLKDYAIENGIDLAVDVNYRAGAEKKHGGFEGLRKRYLETVSEGTIIKMSDEEMSIATGLDRADYAAGAKMIAGVGRRKKVVAVTLGAEGAYYYVNEEDRGYVPGFQVKAVDTTGCGDCYLGVISYYLACEPHVPMGEAAVVANAAGALCASKMGAFDSMPTRQEVFALIAGRGIELRHAKT